MFLLELVTLLLPGGATGGVLQEKVFLEILQNSQENTFTRGSFLIKLQASDLQLYLKRDSGTGGRSETLLKKRLWHRCFRGASRVFRGQGPKL